MYRYYYYNKKYKTTTRRMFLKVFNSKLIHYHRYSTVFQRGKAREYKIGTFLRNYYSDYLNEVYRPEDIYVRTTDYDRTKMSALTCLAGLYPPQKDQIWNKELLWQPIPYHTMPFEEDDVNAF